MKTRSPVFISRIALSACGLRTPSQTVSFSRSNCSIEYVSGSVLARKNRFSALAIPGIDDSIVPTGSAPCYDLWSAMKVRTLAVFAGVAVLCAGTVRGQQTPATQAKSTLSSPKTGSEATPTSSDQATPPGTSNATPSPGTPGVTPPAAAPSVSVGPDQAHPPDATK